jgi:hypothetical protein
VTPRVDLPTAEQIKLAIHPWWSGGGTASLIVNVCRREMASIEDAQDVALRLAQRIEKGNSYISDEVVAETLEMTRAVGAVRQHREVRTYDRSTSDFDPMKCLFGEGVSCPQCTRIYKEPIVHGRLLEGQELTQFFADWRAYVEAVAQEEANGLA